jgi:transcriptional regulator with PAS, ATPase and Fis domain
MFINLPLAAPITGMDASSCTEAEQIAGLLNQRRRNKTKAAQLLNMSRSTLWRKIKKYGLEW